jgi:hypothetical protein
MFDANPRALTYFEPLYPWMHCFGHMGGERSAVRAALALLSCDINGTALPLSCEGDGRVRSMPLASATILNTTHARDMRSRISQSIGSCQRQLNACGGTVATKVIRLVGMLGLMRDELARALRPPGRRLVVIQLIRDPRAVLASRRALKRVGPALALPKSRLAADVAEWAEAMCGLTWRDMRVGDQILTTADPRGGGGGGGGGRALAYMRLRYEDLVNEPRASVAAVYRLLGTKVPAKVSAFIQRLIPPARQQPATRRSMLRPAKNSYSVGGRAAKGRQALLHGWINTLSVEEVQAVERALSCQLVMRRMRYAPAPDSAGAGAPLSLARTAAGARADSKSDKPSERSRLGA